MSQGGEEDDRSQPGFISTVLSVLSGSRRHRYPASSSKFDPIQEQNISQPDRLASREIAPDRVSSDIRNEDATPPPEMLSKSEKIFRYDEGRQTLANEGSSSGFRYFKHGEDDGPSLLSSVVGNAGHAGDDSHANVLLTGSVSPLGDQSKFLSNPPFPLSRPGAGYAPHVSSSVTHRPYARDERPHDGMDDVSVARLGQWNTQNITQRDFNKRPKERPRDKVYKQRFSMGGSSCVPEYRSNVVFRTDVDPRLVNVEKFSPKNTPAPSGFGHLEQRINSSSPLRGASNSPSDGTFEIFLTFSGGTVVHRVWDSMPIAQLVFDAGILFGLDHQDLALILFSGSQGPTPISLTGRVSGPPRISPASTVFVFYVPGQRPLVAPPPPPLYSHSDRESSLSGLSPKLLASFKLPKFDGVARNWKGWEKAFSRFLGIHQLDHVLEENFLESLWTAPGAKAANKMVFFLVEDAVATGTLASRLVRQATKWNGHEAFVMLRNGYVFNGPQTATILLAELSRLRLKRDEDASTFCFRLVELVEDLELIPGDAAVFLTDTQKLGYLLSAIRHESSLQSVYVQL